MFSDALTLHAGVARLLATGSTSSSSRLPEALIALAAACVGVALAWRAFAHKRAFSVIRAGLRSARPETRIAAVLQAGELGLSRTSPTLLTAVRAEKDPTVLAAVVEVVASRQWEPASTAAIVELRLWAKAYADTRPEIQHQPTSTGAPLLAGVAGTTTPASLNLSNDLAVARRSDTDVAAQVAAVKALGPGPDPDPMTATRVLVTGAGGPAGVAVIRALRAAGHHVIAADANSAAAGLYLGSEGHLLPPATDPTFLTAVIRLATLTGAHALIGTVTEEYPALIAGAGYLAEAGVTTWLPSPEAVNSCVDKWAFAHAMHAAGVPHPVTGLASADGVPGPWVVKPRAGRGSRDVHLVGDAVRLAAAIALTPDAIVQNAVTGSEFTADVLIGPTGVLCGCVARWRHETKGGISTYGTTFDDLAVTSVVARAVAAVGLVGPANVQGFVTADGGVVIIEINPRFSGGLPLSLHAGADLVVEYLRAILGRDIRRNRLVATAGVSMRRYFDELYTTD